MDYIMSKYVTSEQIRRVRNKLGMTQKEFAVFAGCSKPTVERWESSDQHITGPIVTLLEILKRDEKWPQKLSLPAEHGRLRLFYMYEEDICTVIDVNEVAREVRIKNYTDNIMFRAFGKNTEPSFEEYEEFVESRCFPRSRDKMKIELQKLGVPFYDPILIIEKTEGRMAEDHFWIRLER